MLALKSQFTNRSETTSLPKGVDDAKNWEVAKQFEAMFLQQMIIKIGERLTSQND